MHIYVCPKASHCLQVALHLELCRGLLDEWLLPYAQCYSPPPRPRAARGDAITLSGNTASATVGRRVSHPL